MGRFLYALRFLETAGGVRPADQLSASPLLEAAVAEHHVCNASGVTHAVRKAPQTPLAFVVMWECFVMDSSLAVALRMYSWYRSVRAWTAMRFDDHRGLVPDRIVSEHGILKGTLVRTKTTGAGKKREELTIAVGQDVFAREPDWMCTGWRLWQAFDTPRDFVPRGADTGFGFHAGH